MEKEIIIIGAGIGGLALALFLNKGNIACSVYEARPLKENIGGGLNVAPNGMNILDQLGLASALYSRGSLAFENCFYNEKGELITKYKNVDLDQYGLPSVSLTRYALFDVLLQACIERGIKVHFGKRLKAIDEQNNGLTAFFEDGTNISGDWLIGADGTNSTTRQIVFKDAPQPQFVGLTAFGGIVKRLDASLITTREKQSLNFTLGPAGFFGYIGINDGDVMWWANLPRPTAMTRHEIDAFTTEKVKAAMNDTFKGYHNTIKQLIDQSYATLSYNIMDMPSLDKWHSGRVLLIGDAAHAVSPNSGQGASMALEDAIFLAKLIRSGDSNCENIFQSFQNERKQRVERVVAEGRKRGNDKQVMTPAQSKVREKFIKIILGLFGAYLQKWLYTYRINWED